MKKIILTIPAFIFYTFVCGQVTLCPGKFTDPNMDTIQIPTVNNMPITPNNNTYSRLHGRDIFMVHGYAGNEDSWALQEPWLSGNFNVRAHRLAYTNTQSSLESAASFIRGEIQLRLNSNTPEENELSFVIAHSLGGLVSRRLDQMYDNNIGNWDRGMNGLITFGTSHNGVQFANTLIETPELVEDFLSSACSELSAGPLAEVQRGVVANAIDITPVLGLVDLAVGFDLTNITDNLCPMLAGPLLGVGQLLFQEDLSDELVVGSPEIASFANFPNASTIPNVIAVYGVEDINREDNLFQKFLGSVINPPSSYPLWGADASDQEGIDLFDNSITEMNLRIAQLENDLALIDSAPWGSQWLFNFLLQKRRVRNSIQAFNRGLAWHEGVNQQWLTLIGANEFTTTETLQCNVPLGNDLYTSFSVSSPANCVCDDCFITTVPGLTIEQRESDGFVLAESALGLPGQSAPEFRMRESGHFQMRNNRETERVFRSIFEDSRQNNFFYLGN